MIADLRYEHATGDGKKPGKRGGSTKPGGWHIPISQSIAPYHDNEVTGHFHVAQARFQLSSRYVPLFETKAKAFCIGMRLIANAIIKGNEPDKKLVMKKTGLMGREYNLAHSNASGMVASAETLLIEKRSSLASAIKSLRAVTRKSAEMGERGKLSRRLKNALCKKISLAKKTPRSPNIFIGGSWLYRHQPDRVTQLKQHEEWRRLWDLSRNHMFGARGSSDESGGNQTFQIRFKSIAEREITFANKRCPTFDYVFSVHHSKHGEVGHFSLDEREGKSLQTQLLINAQKVDRTKQAKKNTSKSAKIVYRDWGERVPLKVEFRRRKQANPYGYAKKIAVDEGNKEGWMIYVGTPLNVQKLIPRENIAGAIGVDTNNGHFDSCEVGFDGKDYKLGRYDNNEYSVDGPAGTRKNAIDAHIRRLVLRAKSLNYAIVLENLDWENGQKARGHSGLRNKLGATLSAMPYRKILYKFMRECARHGVPFRLVNAAYTSKVGNLVASHNPSLSRDASAAAIIAMKGLSPLTLDAYIKRAISSCAQNPRRGLRINVKGHFGQHITESWLVARWCQTNEQSLEDNHRDNNQVQESRLAMKALRDEVTNLVKEMFEMARGNPTGSDTIYYRVGKVVGEIEGKMRDLMKINDRLAPFLNPVTMRRQKGSCLAAMPGASLS